MNVTKKSSFKEDEIAVCRHPDCQDQVLAEHNNDDSNNNSTNNNNNNNKNLFADTPIAKIKYWRSLPADNIQLGDDVYFECEVKNCKTDKLQN